MNSENSKASDAHRLGNNLSGKMDLRKGYNYVALSELGISYTWKNINNKEKQQVVQRLQAFAFCIVNVIYEHMKPRF